MKNMKTKLVILTLTAFLLVGNVFAQDLAFDSSVSEASENLDLNAVAELFKDSENLEEFEKSLNDSEEGINNLDLDENDEIDYLRVVENVQDDTHLITLQSVLGENEFQDVATIAVEKEADDYNMHIQGTPVIYGANYYIVPSYRNLRTWRLISWIYRPAYRPYRSVFGWRVYPRWWRVRRPVAVNVYRTRTVRFVGRKNFTSSRTVRVKTVNKVKYTSRNSTLVKKKTVVRTNGNKTVVTKKGVKKTTNAATGTTTVTKGKKKTVKTKKGKKTKTKKVKKKKN